MERSREVRVYDEKLNYMNIEKSEALSRRLPDWAVKQNPMNSKMSVINPMAVIDRFNEVFGVGAWNFHTEFISMHDAKMGAKDAFHATSKSTVIVQSEGIHLEQFGGSTNMDRGDALKGSATDALTKIASYLGVGSTIYKNLGNVDAPKPPITLAEACDRLRESTTVEQLETVYKSLPTALRSNGSIVAVATKVKENILEAITT